jgi:fructose-bisphosphate aldolase class I
MSIAARRFRAANLQEECAPMNLAELEATARALVAPGKGILAADEGDDTIALRFGSIKVDSTAENRRAYRELLFTTRGIEEFVSGVILFDETLRQKARDRTPFPQLLAGRGIIVGAKVDTGMTSLPGSPRERLTLGFDGLAERLEEYRELGARFAKWRAVIAVGDGLPTHACIRAHAEALALYASRCQEKGLVPIVEPEVLMEGDHAIERCEELTALALHAVFAALFEQGVHLEGILLKPNMVVSGSACPQQAAPDQVAEATRRCFRRTVPAAVPGIVFLSGGLSAVRATSNLNAMNALGPAPWELSFSFGRALQESALKAWKGQAANAGATQQAFYHRCRCNGAARYGRYTDPMEAAAA